MRNQLSTAALLLSLASLASAHDGDPKMYDVAPAYVGPGFRSSAPVQDGDLFLGSGEWGPPARFESQGVQLMSWITLDELDGGFIGNDCWGYTSPSGRRYAVMGHVRGCTFVEVTDPGNAQVIGMIPGAGGLWGDIKVFDQFAYYVSESGGGIQVIDLSAIDQGVVQVVNTITDGGSTSTHNVAIDTTSGFLYRCGGAGNGLRIYSLNNPASPQLVATWSDRYVHDAQVVTYDSGPFAGRQIAFLCSGFGNGGSQTRFEVLDVTNKNQIFTRDRVFYSGAQYSHQVWVDDERQYAYLNDEADEGGGALTRTIAFDISDLDDLSEVSTFTNDSKAVGHNLYVRGDYIFEANYTSGLRIFDATNRVQPFESAYFDTFADTDTAGFNGMWSCYPFFDNQTILGSDRQKGLFVLWFGEPEVGFEFPNGIPEEITPDGAGVTVRLTEQQVGDLDPQSPTLFYDDGSGVGSAPLVPLGGDLWRADLPATECGRDLRWFVSARSTSGIEWRAPEGAPRASAVTRVQDSSVILAEFDFETDQGWSRSDTLDTAASGRWQREQPLSGLGAPHNDITEAGTYCWLTGRFQDVNGGETNLFSPTFDLSAANDPWFEYWAWFSAELDNVNSTDRLQVYLSDDDGESWVLSEQILPNDFETDFGWFRFSLRVRDHVAATSKVRLRFRTYDFPANNVIEAAIDEVVLRDRVCNDCGFEPFCVSTPNSAGAGAMIHAQGSASVGANDLVLVTDGAIANEFGLFYYGPEELQVPFGDGLRCVGAGALGTFRLDPVVLVGLDGRAVRPVDLTAPPAAGGPGAIQPGSSWSFQFWYRDPFAGGTGFNLSDGLTVLFCP